LSFVVQYLVGGGPDGDAAYVEEWHEDTLKATRQGTDPAATVTVKIPHEDAVAIEAGDADPNVLFMQGRLKVDGNMGQMMRVLRARSAKP
jgi:predicted lipid carrier protein YhbT